jgi:hypothetical protein
MAEESAATPFVVTAPVSRAGHLVRSFLASTDLKIAAEPKISKEIQRRLSRAFPGESQGDGGKTRLAASRVVISGRVAQPDGHLVKFMPVPRVVLIEESFPTGARLSEIFGGTVANIEKHLKPTVEQIDQADSSAVPTCARASHLIGRYIKNHQKFFDWRISRQHRTTSNKSGKRSGC